MTKYSKSTNGFYRDATRSDIPSDAVEISTEAYEALLAGQSAGKVITSDENGAPTLVDPPAPSQDARWALIRRRRNALLVASDKTQIADYPITADVKEEWATYRQALRDLPDHIEDPANPEWPSPPA